MKINVDNQIDEIYYSQRETSAANKHKRHIINSDS